MKILRVLGFCTMVAFSPHLALADNVEISFERSPIYNILSIYANLQDCTILYNEEKITDRLVTFVTESPLTQAEAIAKIEELIEEEGFALKSDTEKDYILTRVLSDAELSAKRGAEGTESAIEYETRTRIISMSGPAPRILFVDSEGKRWVAPP